MMRIARELNLHKCAVCSKPLGDHDFISIGLNFRAPLQLFFDYICPGCGHRGRYKVDLKPQIKTLEALETLTAQIDDDDESADEKIAWDSFQWE